MGLFFEDRCMQLAVYHNIQYLMYSNEYSVEAGGVNRHTV